MTEIEDNVELLFFDTFSHESAADINLDLVQFPKPVYITQVRIIPLGARVKADFPGGVRLGATNPSTFGIEFFVNDLGLPGASAFEILGNLEYNQNDCIHLECTQERIPTDGLVLRGWYSTITLAVYGILTNSVHDPIASPTPCAPDDSGEELCNAVDDARNVEMDEELLKEEWKEPPEIGHAHKGNASDYEREDYEYAAPHEHHYHHSGDERERRLRKRSQSTECSPGQRNRTHSESNERDYTRSYHGMKNKKSGSGRDASRSPDYTKRTRQKRTERSRSEAEDAHKWPRTPPASIGSPNRPRSPDNWDDDEQDVSYAVKKRPYMRSTESLDTNGKETHTVDGEDTPGTPVEHFEPILSDDEIIGDDDFNSEAEQATADEFEAELESAAALAEPAISTFDPFKMPIGKYECDLCSHYSKELENLRLLYKKYALQTQIGGVEAFKDNAVSIIERENFVYLSEQLINQLAFLGQQFKRRNFVLTQFFQEDRQHLEQTARILQIALDFEAACLQAQPAFKIRHIKIGARLTELLGVSRELIEYLLFEASYDAFAALFKLYHEQYMAPSIKLLLLRGVYALLDTKTGVNLFLYSKVNGYQMVLETLKTTHVTRTKYALRALILKLNLNEALQEIQQNCARVLGATDYDFNESAAPFLLIERGIQQLLDAFTLNGLAYQQPRRFLPVSKKFEIVSDPVAQRNFAHTLQAYFVQHALGESLLLLLCNASRLPASLLLQCLDLLDALLQTYIGVDYFADSCYETGKLLVATLLGIEEVPQAQKMAVAVKAEAVPPEKVCSPMAVDKSDEAAESKPTVEEPGVKPTHEEDTCSTTLEENMHRLDKPTLNRLKRLGVELAYKMQTRYHLDAIVYTAAATDCDANLLASHLHHLYSQTCNAAGRRHTVEFISQNNNIQVFMDLIKKEQRLQSQRQLAMPGTKYKSPVLSYAVDIVDCCVRYCENLDYLMEHGQKILELAKNHETFEPSVSAVLQELYVYLKPLEVIKIFSYDDITPLVEVITRSLEYITTFPGDLIMGLRILRHLVTGPARHNFKSAETAELKHRFVALQFYANDGMQTLLQILERLCAYFEQPGLHIPALVTIQGVHCCQILLPTLQILRELLSFAVQCRDVEFRDLSAVDHLMKSYYLLYCFPKASQAASEVQMAKDEVIRTLLAYTQPNEQDEESLHKSLWTQMIREVLKNIDFPSTFIPGLQVLTELLPLPLPIPLPANVTLTKQQIQRLITQRKLWSAHLHPQSQQLAKLIDTIAPSSYPQLSDLLTRVCLQLADLAPNMTLLISKTMTDALCAEWTNAASIPTLNLLRLLYCFGRLTAYASLKSSAITILSGRLWELFQALLTTKAGPVELLAKCQLTVHRILESFLDTEISLVSPDSCATPELNLASALPPKELIPRIIEATLTNLLNVEVTHEVSAMCVRNLVIMTEHDITFYHLSLLLKQRASEFQQWLLKIIQVNESESYNSNIKSLVLLLRSLVDIEAPTNEHSVIPPRTLKLTTAELAQLIGYEKDAAGASLLQRIRTVFENHKQKSSAALADINRLIAQLETAEDGAPMDTTEDDERVKEPSLPQAEGIVTQYAARPMFNICSTPSSLPQLTESYWFKPNGIDAFPSEDCDAQYDRVPCDLNELAKSLLLLESNLTTDCKRILHLSASPQSNRERTPTAPCFRTRRVEVEPSTGRPEKKIYVTPVRGRGYPRAPPSRGDLFRSRPPNTSRPPSLHVDDFLALETCGAQPTGPTGYNKIPPIMRGTRIGRNRGSRISTAAAFRKTKLLRTSSPSTWNDGGSPHYRPISSESHFVGEPHYATSPHYRGAKSTRPPSRYMRRF